jgi:hypothetical protein
VLLFALALSATLVLIVDLDRSQQGLVNVSQRTMYDLQRQFALPVP